MLVEVLGNQNKMLEQLAKPRQANSTIRVEPKVHWPHFGDGGPGGNEVEEFYEKFEDICGLANNGQGMADKEMLVALKSCLHGSRRMIFDNIYKQNKTKLDSPEGPGDVYKEVKARHFRFIETATEKQLRVSSEWHNLAKGKNNALQFEAEWERIHAELEEVGLGKNKLEKFLQYITKVGPALSEMIRTDMRPRSDGSGGTTTRRCESWEEAHAVLVESETIKAGSRAFSSARAAGQTANQETMYNTGAFGDGGGKGTKGKGRGKGGKGKDGERSQQPCYNWKEHGTCKYGDSCRFSHDPATTGRSASGALTKAETKRRAAAQGGGPAPKVKAEPKKPAGAADQTGAFGNGRGRGRGRGKPTKGGGRGKGGGDPPTGKKRQICKHYRDHDKHGNCPDKSNCKYSHIVKHFNKKWKYIGPGSKRSGGQDVVVDDEAEDDTWDEPRGLAGAVICECTWPSGSVPTTPAAVVRSEPSAGRRREGPSQATQCSELEIKFPDAHARNSVVHETGNQIRSAAEQQGAKPKAGIRKGPKTVNRLSELPDKCWKFAPQDDSGIQFFTEAKVGLSSYSFMLDGGSGVNSTTEELIIELLNENEKAGISLNDKRHPIKCFEKWHHTEALRGVAGGAQVKLLGAVVVLSLIHI